MDHRFILVQLLVRLGVATAIAAAVVRSRFFTQPMVRDERTPAERIHMLLFLVVPFALGVMVRQSVHTFLAADEAFEGAIILGVIGGRAMGTIGGALMAIPAVMHGEYLTLPLNMLVGLIAGMIRHFAPDKEKIWSFSPFVDLSIYRWIKRNIRKPQLDWQTVFFVFILVANWGRMELGSHFSGQVFYIPIDNHDWPTLIAYYATVVAVVAIPLKVWNSARIEMKLEQQERLLLQARMEALQSQINPHFLFNTLNSISSLIRVDPENAREVILKLSSMLRHMLKKTDAFVALQEEIELIDDYLEIEIVRFGPEKLKIIKDLEPATLEMTVPSMLLQPLLENSIKHGLTPKPEGGSITLRSRIVGEKLLVEIEDDGVGMGITGSLSEAPESAGSGIGVANVLERLRVLYGDAAHVAVDSPAGEGTRISIWLPLLDAESVGLLPSEEIRQRARSSTSR